MVGPDLPEKCIGLRFDLDKSFTNAETYFLRCFKGLLRNFMVGLGHTIFVFRETFAASRFAKT